MQQQTCRFTVWIVVVLALALHGCSKATEEPSGTSSPGSLPHPPPRAPEPAPTPSPLERLLTKTTLVDALDDVRPMMTDTYNEDSTGAVALALWAHGRLRWPEIAVKKNETSFARVRKDSDASRGKRMCIRGRLIQITKDDSAGVALYLGLMLVGYSDIARFIAVGDTGELVERSAARLCGVVTGTYDYANSGGGTGHAVSMVGMFDLPANRQASAP